MLIAGLVLAAALAAPGAEVAQGKALFGVHCARCHGDQGKGDGPASAFLEPPPANLARGDFMFRSTPTGCAPTDEDLFARLGLGIPGTAMPAFTRLTAPDRWALVAYVRALATPHPTCKQVAVPAPPPPTDLAEGRALYQRLGCASCHGADGRGAQVSGPLDALGQARRSADLTQAQTLRGGTKPVDLYLRITTGIDSTAMPSYAESASDAERWQLAVYLASLQVPGSGEDPSPRGRRLLFALGCAYCHSAVHPDGSYDTARRFGGGQVVEVTPLAAYAPGNLTPRGLSGWSDGELQQAITDGVAPHGRRLDPLAMPWPYFHALSTEDAQALVAALRALPEVDPLPVHPVQPPLGQRLRAKWTLFRGQPQPLELVVRPATLAEGGQ